MNAKKETVLEIAERAFTEATRNAYPADLIKILYEDLVKARKNTAKRR